MKSSFDERYITLNSEQKRAVDAIDGPVMVIAGPGTGKTTVLTLRIANILKRTDTPASGILALTFTEAGAKVMRMKLREIIGTRADEVHIHTYHGFAASIIVEFENHFPHLSRAKQITEIEAESIVRDILKDKKFFKLRPGGEPELYVSKIIKTISDAKKEIWSPDIIRSFAKEEIERIKNDETSISSRGATKGKLKGDALARIEKCERTILFADVYETYEKKKLEEKKTDFDDLIFELSRALKTDELLLRLIQEKFLYLLVDEHQDTNDSQNSLIRMIADFFDTPNLFIVGDEKQAIYRFQGASVENFLHFQNMWKSMEIISLTDNYRSHQAILDATFSMIERNYEEGAHMNLRVKLVSKASHASKPIDVIIAGNTESSEQYLVKEIKAIVDKDKEASIAVIVRRNRDVERAMALFESEGVSASAERGIDIFSHPIGILFFDIIEYLADISKTEALAKTIASGLWRLDFASATHLVKNIRSGIFTEIEKEIPAIAKLQREIQRSGTISFLIDAADISGFTEMAARNPFSAEVWRAIVALASDIAGRGGIDDPKTLIGELLAYRASAETKSVKVSLGSSLAQVRVMTSHGSKGLEFDYVFLPYATEESWMPRSRGSYFVLPREKDDSDEIRDARRLFYVALTRAKRHVSIILGLAEGTGRELLPLRFIDELNPQSVSKKEIPAVSAMPISKGSAVIDVKRKNELMDYTKNILLERGLSVTALNHFMKCPSEFFYKSVLKLPEPPSAGSEKGNAMHEAFARVWALEDKSEENIVNTICETVRTYFSRSLLPLFEKEPAVEELIKNAPIVELALKNHFESQGVVSVETWIETSQESKYQNEKITLKLHGKLDAIVEGNSIVSVFDYKTREAMSPAEIKGETKNSDGGYFRQLVFYKLLLNSNIKYKGKIIEPALVFIKPDKKGKCPIIALPIETNDIEQVKTEVQSLIDSVWSGKLFSNTCDDPKCSWCALKREIGS